MNFCEELGIDKPLIQAPMAGVQDWRLAAEVSNAGGLGSIPCGMLSAEQLVQQLHSFKKHSPHSYNVNFFCHDMPKLDAQRLKSWQDSLFAYYEEFKVEAPSGVSGLRVPFDNSFADILEEFKPPVISFHFGLPAPELLDRVKAWGSKVLSSATTMEEGCWLAENGADIVIAQGLEAGGHRGMFLKADLDQQLGTADLVSQLRESISLPIVAAGGINNYSDIVSMMELGASAAQLGTAYLLCNEASTSAVHRAAIKQGTAQTALTNVFSGRLARGITNRAMAELNFISTLAPEFPYASIALAPLRAAAEQCGRDDFTPLWAGSNYAACTEISAGELTQQLWPK
ncbi:MAG: nitronate monooxygenase [Cellvibrionaceae bacterium]|nr:nitronate monooxygenase [Cellvibrionaceae bacterium]